MAGVWKEDGSYEYAPGERARLKGKEKGKEKGKGKDKGKGEKGKGKGKEKGKDRHCQVVFLSRLYRYSSEVQVVCKDSMTAAERLAFAQGALPGAAEEEEEELPEFDFEKDRPWQHPAPRAGMRAQDWKDKSVALLNLKGAKDLNGLMGVVKEYNEETKRFLVCVEGGKGEKSIKMENIFKVMTGCIVKLRGLDSIELNEACLILHMRCTTYYYCACQDVTSKRNLQTSSWWPDTNLPRWPVIHARWTVSERPMAFGSGA
eukprot:s254_g3.t1